VRTVLNVVGASIMVVLAVWTVWRFFAASPAALDASTVMVFPLDDLGGGEEGILTGVFLPSVLVHVEPLRFRDAWSFLAPEHKADIQALDQAGRRQLTVDRGAAYWVDGRVVTMDDSVTVTLLLWDAGADSILAQERMSGRLAEASAPRLGLEAMLQLLPAVVREVPTRDLGLFLDRDPRAVALWIQGEREYRQARFEAAFGLFEGAVVADSSLVLAALKGAQAAGWSHRPERGVELARAALRHEALLPPRHRSLARGLLAYVEGRADEAVTAFRAALAEDGDWGEAWTLLGETYRHLLPADVVPDSSDTHAFERAVQTDSTFHPPLIHLAEQALREGRLEVADRLLARLTASNADARSLARLAVMRACRREGPGRVDWGAFLVPDTVAVFDAAKLLAAGGAHPPCAEAAFAAVYDSGAEPGLRWGALQGLHGVRVATGQDREARALIESADAPAPARLLHLLDGWVVQASAAEADRFVAERRRLTGGTYSDQPRTQWLVGSWLARRGEADEVARLRDALAGSPDPEATLLVAALGGHFALLRGEADQALTLFEAIPSRSPRVALGYELGAGFPVERLLAACLRLAQGDGVRAAAAARVLDHGQPMSFLAFLPTSLAVRAQAARSLGDTELEARMNERLLDLGRDDLVARDVCSSLQGGRG
jgi:tetratricopeptide (TPR) repeat protein